MWQSGRRPEERRQFRGPPGQKGLLLRVEDLDEPPGNASRFLQRQTTPRAATGDPFLRPFKGTRSASAAAAVKDLYADDGQRIKIEHYANERSTRENLYLFFYKNRRVNITVCGILFALKLLTCILYVIRVILDDAAKADCYDCNDQPCKYLANFQWPFNCSEMEGNSDALCWESLLWVQNPLPIWGLQVAIAIWTLSQTLFLTFLKYKGDIWKIIDFLFLLELFNSIPFIVTLYSTPWRNVFIPVFLNCWIAKYTVEYAIIHHSVLQSGTFLSQQLFFVGSTLLCLAFTSVCGFQHIQRVGCRRYNLFESSYFVAVTLSTVGYGDLFPDIWLSKLFMVLMICIALAVMPKKFESLAFSWMERQKVGGAYKKPRSRPDQHVVVCTTYVSVDTLTDFLTEFFSYRQLMDVTVVFLASSELNIETRQVLMSPVWSQKVVYIKGSCLKDADLRRVRMKDADACFILGADPSVSKSVADEHTILRSWAVKDFAPGVPQYVKIFRPENKVHLKFADYIVCEDEIKYAMLACNCICPGASTLITLLLHTSRGEEGQTYDDEWIRLYGKGSGNEFYHVVLKDSLIFNEYEGKSFTYTSLHTHRKYGVVLIGVKSTHDSRDSYIKLNPGPDQLMKATDICYYLSLTGEENMNFQVDKPRSSSSKLLRIREALFGRNFKGVQPSIPKGTGRAVDRHHDEPTSPLRTRVEEDSPEWLINIEQCDILTDYPRVSPYVGTSPTLCHIRSEKRQSCCMELDKPCEHNKNIHAQQYEWPTREIIVVAEAANNGIYNFIVPLRAHHLRKSTLQPIIFLLQKRPDQPFLDAISWFPLIYFMQGSIQNLDDLLRAGIILADNVVVVNKEMNDVRYNEEDLADSNTIVAVQSVLEFFPSVKITTELSQSSNMRFMHFQASNSYAIYLSEIEQREKDNGSNISFMFRLQFASGSVFSANMMDTLLYQAIVKDYIITVIKLLLGIDQAPGSGYLTAIKISRQQFKEFATYGALFAELCANGGDIPICIYRTQKNADNATSPTSEETDVFSIDSWESFTRDMRSAEVNNLITSRMENLGMKWNAQDLTKQDRTRVSYVIINPDCDLPLEEEDVIFVLRPNRLHSFPIYRRRSMTHRSTQTLLPQNKDGRNGTGGADSTYSSMQSHPSSFGSSSVEGGSFNPNGANSQRRPIADRNSRPRAPLSNVNHFAYQY